MTLPDAVRRVIARAFKMVRYGREGGGALPLRA